MKYIVAKQELESYTADIADSVIWLAQERMKSERFQNINSAIHAVYLDVSQYLMIFMDKHKV